MTNVGFYDGDWQRLLRQYPLAAKKIEELRCEAVSFEEFENLLKRVEELEKVLAKTNLLKRRCKT